MDQVAVDVDEAVVRAIATPHHVVVPYLTTRKSTRTEHTVAVMHSCYNTPAHTVSCVPHTAPSVCAWQIIQRLPVYMKRDALTQ